MSQNEVVASFTFVTNKSFCTARHKPITIPSRICPTLKEHGLGDKVRVRVTYPDSPNLVGSIRAGWRAGGKYFQITATVPSDHGLARLRLETPLEVRLKKCDDDWMVELHEKG